MQMFKPAALALAVMFLATPSSGAETPPPALKAAFGNTILSTYPDGRTARMWLAPDGTYSGTGRRKLPSSGRWTVKDDKLCLKQQKPMPAPMSFCTPLPQGVPGSSWKTKAATGEQIQVKIVPGKAPG
jgi:hypothetical protein